MKTRNLHGRDKREYAHLRARGGGPYVVLGVVQLLRHKGGQTLT